jgi:hypothetical protein
MDSIWDSNFRDFHHMLNIKLYVFRIKIELNKAKTFDFKLYFYFINFFH